MPSSLILALAVAATGGAQVAPHAHTHHNHHHHDGGRIAPPLPGLGAGFPNGNPDGYGYVDFGLHLPIGADRVPEYYFPRYLSVPANQAFMPTYYNAYVTRGQRYIPYAGCGGWHPMGGPPAVSATTPVRPYTDTGGGGPVVPVPVLGGRTEAPPMATGRTGLTP